MTKQPNQTVRHLVEVPTLPPNIAALDLSREEVIEILNCHAALLRKAGLVTAAYDLHIVREWIIQSHHLSRESVNDGITKSLEQGE